MRQFYAYCLMTNHIHLLMREHDEQIEESVKRMDHENRPQISRYKIEWGEML